MTEIEGAGLEKVLLDVARQIEDQGSSDEANYLRRCVSDLRGAWCGADRYEDPMLALVVIRDSAQSLLEAVHRRGGF